jgi:hypothetical protein
MRALTSDQMGFVGIFIIRFKAFMIYHFIFRIYLQETASELFDVD